MKRSCLITGAAGGIGSALTAHFRKAGWYVVATGRKAPSSVGDYDVFISADLNQLAQDDAALDAFKSQVESALNNAPDAGPITAVINNAAVQILGASETLTAQDMAISFNVNVIAPFRLVQAFLPDLKANKGAVLNIGTVHAQSTKSEFVAYATSKTAMHGLTRALAVDLGPEVRVNTLAPAATQTPMLMAGFEGREAAYKALADAHPLERIAHVSEIAKAALFLCSDDASFITGATLYADGGVLSRLHDPA